MSKSSLGKVAGEGIIGRENHMARESWEHKIAQCSQRNQLIQYGREWEVEERRQTRLG